MAEKNKNENKGQSPVEIYNSHEAQSRREKIRKEINSTPRVDYSHAFQKTDAEKGEWWTERAKWRKSIKRAGYTKKNVPMQTYVKG